ncbi:MAG: hypothetical protein OXE17_02060 [Chloroflexi bacterium]|nr:hypothetical protein [Chloroflexota bacterium]
MAMNAELHQHIIEAISRKIGNRKLVCPVSGHTDSWGVDINGAALPVANEPGGLVSAHNDVFPVAVIVCEECGYTFLMNLLKLGLADELGAETPVNA